MYVYIYIHRDREREIHTSGAARRAAGGRGAARRGPGNVRPSKIRLGSGRTPEFPDAHFVNRG